MRRASSSGERFVVGQERTGRSDVGFGLTVDAGMNGIVRPLEQHGLAVLDEFDAGIIVARVEIGEALARKDHRNGDVVLHLDFVRGVEVGAEFENAPRALGIVADAEIIANEFLVVIAEFVAELAVDAIDGKVLAPAGAPFGTIVAFHGEDELPDGCGRLRSQSLYSAV